MIGLDTNVLLRFFLEDDPQQSERAKALVASLSRQEPGYISSVVLAEAFWVLQRGYRKSKPELLAFIASLLGAQQMVLENHAAVAEAMHRFEHSNADFVDCFIERICSLGGCSRTMTFDDRASKVAGMVAL
ncbi:MAG: type II toxin-antitoxin system VapC family toxin [Terracidiphilus sp.]|jgi:predicted nucleic-acid-binding protein